MNKKIHPQSSLISMTFIFLIYSSNFSSAEESQDGLKETKVELTNAITLSLSFNKQANYQDLSKSLKGIDADIVDTVKSIEKNLKKKDYPAVGNQVLKTVISSALRAPRSVRKVISKFGGNHYENQARLTIQVYENMHDNRTNLQKRMDKVGYDPIRELGSSYSDLSIHGGWEQYQADLRKGLTERERLYAENDGTSYIPNVYTAEEIIDYEKKSAQKRAGSFKGFSPDAMKNSCNLSPSEQTSLTKAEKEKICERRKEICANSKKGKPIDLNNLVSEEKKFEFIKARGKVNRLQREIKRIPRCITKANTSAVKARFICGDISQRKRKLKEAKSKLKEIENTVVDNACGRPEFPKIEIIDTRTGILKKSKSVKERTPRVFNTIEDR